MLSQELSRCKVICFYLRFAFNSAKLMQTDTQKLIPVYTKLISGLYHLEISLNLKRV